MYATLSRKVAQYAEIKRALLTPTNNANGTDVLRQEQPVNVIEQHEQLVTEQLRADLLAAVDDNHALAQMLAVEVDRAKTLELAVIEAQTAEIDEREKRESLVRKYRMLQSEYESAAATVNRMKKELRQLRRSTEVVTREKENEAALAEKNTFLSRISELEQRLKQKDDLLKQSEVDIEALQAANKRQEETINGLQAKLNVDRATLLEVSRELSEAKRQNSRLRRDAQRDGLAQRKLSDSIKELQEQLRTQEQDVQKAVSAERKRLSAQIKHMQSERVRMQLRMKAISGTHRALNMSNLCNFIGVTSRPSSSPEKQSRGFSAPPARPHSSREAVDTVEQERCVPEPRQKTEPGVADALYDQLAAMQYQYQLLQAEHRRTEQNLTIAQHRIRELNIALRISQDTAHAATNRSNHLLRDLLQRSHTASSSPPSAIYDMYMEPVPRTRSPPRIFAAHRVSTVVQAASDEQPRPESGAPVIVDTRAHGTLSLQQLAMLSPSALPSPFPAARNMGDLVTKPNCRDSSPPLAMDPVQPTSADDTTSPSVARAVKRIAFDEPLSFAVLSERLAQSDSSCTSPHSPGTPQPHPPDDRVKVSSTVQLLKHLAELNLSAVPEDTRNLAEQLQQECTQLLALIEEHRTLLAAGDPATTRGSETALSPSAVRKMRGSKRPVSHQWDIVGNIRDKLWALIRQ